MPADLPRNRLGFAHWLLRPENPLTARVTVNRFWQELFGTGMVKTSGDFGVTGDMPSHPELLDWLAVDFRESGWDVKRFFKLMVMSATYRQSAVATPEKIEQRPGQPPALARAALPHGRGNGARLRAGSSGLLVEKIGGPSVRPYQPPGIWDIVGMPGRRHAQLQAGSRRQLVSPQPLYLLETPGAAGLDGDFQRAVARNLHRAPRAHGHAVAGAGDAERSAVRRGRAASGAAQPGSRRTADAAGFHGRTPAGAAVDAGGKENHRGRCCSDLLAHYEADPKDAAKLLAVGESQAGCRNVNKPTLAAYTMVANELMNLDEVLNK